MSESGKSSCSGSTILRGVYISLLSGLSVYSFGELFLVSYSSVFFGDEVLSYNPVSILLFAACAFLLNRFFKKEVLSNIGRVIISCIMGLMLAATAVWSTLMLYGNHSIFYSSMSAFQRIIAFVGVSIFFIPCVSEVVGLADYLFDRNNNSVKETAPFFYEKNNTVYFFVVWLLILLSFIPLFLYSYPINFICDAGYQVNDYMSNGISTHHPILHTVILGFLYKIGYERGDTLSAFVYFTVSQMLLLSASFAFFLRYVKEKGAPRGLRITLSLLFILNPLNAYYAISTIKGVPSAAFLIFALTFLLMLFDKKKPVLNGILFVITSVLSCLFRNNMLYAYVFAGIIVLFLVRGMKKKAVALVLGIAVYLCCVGSNHLLMNIYNASDRDGMREKMSVPLVCLARVCQYHADELDPVIYEEIQKYIDEDTIAKYTYVISDPVKNDANEELLKNNTVNFLKLVAKVGLKYPGDYLEAFVGLTVGYYAPLNCPYFVTGTTKLFTVPAQGGYPMTEVKQGLPIGGEIFDYLYGKQEGRIRIPLFGMLWKGAPYFWSFVFAFFYLIYKKRPGNLCILMFPLLYMMSCLFGPTSFLRYICINITALPIAIYLIMSKDVGCDTTDSE